MKYDSNINTLFLSFVIIRPNETQDMKNIIIQIQIGLQQKISITNMPIDSGHTDTAHTYNNITNALGL